MRPAKQGDLDLLVTTLERVDMLEDDDALRVPAAFLRVRIEDGQPPTRVELPPTTRPHAAEVDAVDRFLEQRSGGGRRAQAVTAVCFELLHPGA